MLLVGLTGGIGSGKSTVAEMLQRRGAVVLDADQFARRAIDPGRPGHGRVVEAFGEGILSGDGAIDRDRLAARVFADAGARQALEAIIHPEVASLLADALEPYRDSHRVVVYVVPLLVENHLEGMFDLVVTVSAEENARVSRLTGHRGMGEADVRARLAAQASDAERERVADRVIRNDGSKEGLERSVAALWADLADTAARGGPET